MGKIVLRSRVRSLTLRDYIPPVNGWADYQRRFGQACARGYLKNPAHLLPHVQDDLSRYAKTLRPEERLLLVPPRGCRVFSYFGTVHLERHRLSPSDL